MTRLYKNHAFTISHAERSAFEGAGLRAFFEYRKPGIDEGTGRRFGARTSGVVTSAQ